MTTKEKTQEKISAGYFDGNRQSPIYTGDVYKEEGAMIPYHKVIKDPEKGFMVEHVGTVEKFPLKTDAQNLIKKTYVGNEIDNPNLWDEITNTKAESELNRHPQATEQDEETKPENTPAGDEKVEKKPESEEKKDDKKTSPDVIASTKEEKRLQEKRNDYQRRIDELKHKSNELETEAVRFENLASTLTFEPFVELKMIVSNAVQDYAKKQDIKECEKHLKNYKAIDSMEALLKDYKDLAEKNRSNIDLNNKEIDDYEIKVTEINDKLNNFQRKLAFVEPEQPKDEKQAQSEKPTIEKNPEVQTQPEINHTEAEKSPEETKEVKAEEPAEEKQ